MTIESFRALLNQIYLFLFFGERKIIVRVKYFFFYIRGDFSKLNIFGLNYLCSNIYDSRHICELENFTRQLITGATAVNSLIVKF